MDHRGGAATNDRANVIPLTAGAWPRNRAPEPPETTIPAKLNAALLAYAKAFAAGPIPELSNDERRRQALWGLKHISAMDAERGAPLLSICHKITFTGGGTLPSAASVRHRLPRS